MTKKLKVGQINR